MVPTGFIKAHVLRGTVLKSETSYLFVVDTEIPPLILKAVKHGTRSSAPSTPFLALFSFLAIFSVMYIMGNVLG